MRPIPENVAAAIERERKAIDAEAEAARKHIEQALDRIERARKAIPDEPQQPERDSAFGDSLRVPPEEESSSNFQPLKEALWEIYGRLNPMEGQLKEGYSEPIRQGLLKIAFGGDWPRAEQLLNQAKKEDKEGREARQELQDKGLDLLIE